jgi:hypothetical protein
MIRNFIAAASVIFFAFGCATTQTVQTPVDNIAADNEAFLNAPPASSDELFRVVIMSDSYAVVQKGAAETISRVDDKSGDKFICEELSGYDKFNEVREAVLTVWLFPHNGNITKIRPKRLASLIEIDKLLNEDLQRWNFKSPDPKKKTVSPLKFDVRFRVVLRKKQSDEEILKGVREQSKEKG